MSLNTAMENDLAVLFNLDEFARTVTYNGSDIPAIVDFGMQAGESAKAAVVFVKALDVPAPAYRDMVVIDGSTWRVFRDRNQSAEIEGDGHVWKIPITRDERPVI